MRCAGLLFLSGVRKLFKCLAIYSAAIHQNRAEHEEQQENLQQSLDGFFDLLRKHGGKTGEELKGGEPVAEATQSEPPTAEAPDISIHDAAKEGNIEAVKQRLAAGTDVNVKDDGGTCSLHFASVYGHKEIVELLIASGADVNAQSGVGTPLHLAAGFGLNDMATLLIAKGADVNSIDVDGKTPADRAVSEDKKETADLLRKHGGKTGEELHVLHAAIKKGNIGRTPRPKPQKIAHRQCPNLPILISEIHNSVLLQGAGVGKSIAQRMKRVPTDSLHDFCHSGC